GETRDRATDIRWEDGWRDEIDIPDAKKLERAIHVTKVTAASQQKALSEFDAVVQKIEACRGAEIADRSLFAAWKGRFDWRVVLHARGPQRRLCRVGHWMVWRPGICGIRRAREGDTRRGEVDQNRARIFSHRDCRDLPGLAPRQSFDSRLEPGNKQSDHGSAASLVSLRRHSAASARVVHIPAAERIAAGVGENSA